MQQAASLSHHQEEPKASGSSGHDAHPSAVNSSEGVQHTAVQDAQEPKMSGNNGHDAQEPKMSGSNGHDAQEPKTSSSNGHVAQHPKTSSSNGHDASASPAGSSEARQQVGVHEAQKIAGNTAPVSLPSLQVWLQQQKFTSAASISMPVDDFLPSMYLLTCSYAEKERKLVAFCVWLMSLCNVTEIV